jgi:hypothetical protein
MIDDERDNLHESKQQRRKRLRRELNELSRYRDEAGAALEWYLIGQTITATVFNWTVVLNAASFLTAWPVLAMAAPWVLGSYVFAANLLRFGEPRSAHNVFVYYDRDHCLDNIYDRPKSLLSVSSRAGIIGVRNGFANASMSPIYWLKSAAYWLNCYDPEYHFK